MWQFVFWLCLGLVFYSYFGYPLLLALIRRMRQSPAPPREDFVYPPLRLVISAYNEEKVLRRKIENSLSLDYPRDLYSIVVASDGSDDGTVDIVREYADHGVELFDRPERTGKSAVLNAVVAEATEDVIVFTDANSMFEKDALEKLVRNFNDPRIGCVVGRLRYVDPEPSSIAKGEGVYWRYEGMLSRLESSLRSVLVANGSIFAVRTPLYRKLDADVANDLQTPTDVASQGFGIVYEPQAIARESCATVWQEEFRRKVRIVLRGLTGFARMRRQLSGFRLWQFVSHKLTRWLAGPLLFVALFANAILADGSAFYTTLLIAQVLFYMAAARGWYVRRTHRPRLAFYIPFYFTMVNLAAVLATAKFLTGERQSVWVKAESTRVISEPTPAETFVPAAHVEFEPGARHDRVAKT